MLNKRLIGSQLALVRYCTTAFRLLAAAAVAVGALMVAAAWGATASERDAEVVSALGLVACWSGLWSSVLIWNASWLLRWRDVGRGVRVGTCAVGVAAMAALAAGGALGRAVVQPRDAFLLGMEIRTDKPQNMLLPTETLSVEVQPLGRFDRWRIADYAVSSGRLAGMDTQWYFRAGLDPSARWSYYADPRVDVAPGRLVPVEIKVSVQVMGDGDRANSGTRDTSRVPQTLVVFVVSPRAGATTD